MTRRERAVSDADPVGLDQASVERWFRTEVPAAEAPLTFELLAGGHSNLTYRVVDRRGRSFVLRRPPVGRIRPGAHSMEREWRILTALRSSEVPVPSTVGLCADASVTGAEFYVMEHVEGIVIDSEKDAALLDVVARCQLSSTAVQTLAALHTVDPMVIGRDARVRADSYVGRQLALWMQQVGRDGAARTAEIGEVHDLLRDRMPVQRWSVLTHGDYRLGNMLVTPAGAIEAVLDWELWTVGDPLADLGWLAAWWDIQSDDGWSPGAAAGFPSSADLAALYQQLTGRDTSDLGYYVAFALWRLACIAEGVYERYAAGVMGRAATSMEVLEAKPRKLAESARAALR